nr:hypothetical protein Iba_scaffold1241792CG0010 [Ipomoea batatas]GMD48891.1 hypothetical protein Iba_chr10fCG10630 [Ipomoea batatas]
MLTSNPKLGSQNGFLIGWLTMILYSLEPTQLSIRKLWIFRKILLLYRPLKMTPSTGRFYHHHWQLAG